MILVEIIIAGSSERYILHVPENVNVAEIAEIMKTQFKTVNSCGVIYHFKSGRFLCDDATLLRNGVESGDMLMFV